MAEDWLAAYRETDNLNEKYKLLRQEMSHLRAEAGGADRFDPDDVAQTIQEENSEHEEELIVFAANDFGLPVAFRPESLEQADQDEVRRTILAEKYAEHEDLNAIRQRILDRHPAMHKVIVAEYSEDTIRYHLPEGSNSETNFLTVREMVGLVDYTTNSAQSSGLSREY